MKKKIEKCIQKREQLYQNKEVAVKAIHSFFYFYYLLFLAIHSILPFILESDRIMSMLDGNDLIHLYSIFLLYSLDPLFIHLFIILFIQIVFAKIILNIVYLKKKMI